MKKVFFGLVLLCGLALVSTSCNKDNNVTPEVETGTMAIGSNTLSIVTAKDAAFGQHDRCRQRGYCHHLQR